MTKWLFIFLIFTCSIARAHESVPTISIEDFKVNKAWTWSYFNKNKEYYSSERYQVIAVNGDNVVLEMASTYKQNEPMRAHHRIHANVKRCLDAYKTPGVKKAWGIQLYYWTGTYWDSAGNVPTAAFEEKFNCNPHVTNTKKYETLFATSDAALGGVEIFQQRREGKTTSSWFHFTGENSAVAAQRFSDEHDSQFGYELLFQGVSEVTKTTLKY